MFNSLFVDETKARINYSSIVKAGSTYFFEDNARVSLPAKGSCPTIAVFDIAPKKENQVCPINKNYDYMTRLGDPLNFSECFFTTIITLAEKHQLNLVIKPKRHNSSILSGYHEILSKLGQHDRVTIASSEISAFRLVDYCDGGIVQPFTSIGYYDETSTPLTFYDPLSLLDKTLNQQKGQELCSGPDELSEWILRVKTNYWSNLREN